MDLITLEKFNAELMNQILNCSLLKIFELAMFAEEGHVARRQAVAFIRTAADTGVFKQNVELRFVNIYQYCILDLLGSDIVQACKWLS
jgi:hypothetical protein